MSLSNFQLNWAEYIWNRLGNELFKETGVACWEIVAGIMGNLQAESALCPYRLQGDYKWQSSSPYYKYSKEYSDSVSLAILNDNADKIHSFVYEGPNGGGFGLCQWTSSGRKERLVNFFKSDPIKYANNIGSIYCAVDFLLEELKSSYRRSVYDPLLTLALNPDNETNEIIKKASDIVLTKFEIPKDFDKDWKKNERAALGYAIYSYGLKNWVTHLGTPVDLSKHKPVFYGTWGHEDVSSTNIFSELVTTLNKEITRVTYKEEENKYFVDGIYIPFNAPLIEDKYFNTSSKYLGISTCIQGSPNKDRPNTLNNCVGAAWGLFNKTFYENLNFYESLKFLKSNGDGNTCLTNTVELSSNECKFNISDIEEYLINYILDVEPVLSGDELPPLGGLISWGKTTNGNLKANHIGYIAAIDDDKNIYVIESGYNSPGYSWVLRKYFYEHSDPKKAGYKYNECSPIKFLKNPVVCKKGLKTIPLFNLVQIDSRTICVSHSLSHDIKLNYKWILKDGNSTTETRIKEIPSSISTNIKKLREAVGVEAFISYGVSEGDAEITSDIVTISLTPSYPSMKIMSHDGVLKDFIPIMSNNKIYIPIIQKDGKMFALFNTGAERLK